MKYTTAYIDHFRLNITHKPTYLHLGNLNEIKALLILFIYFQKGLYLHEIGHALGLVHEHQLPNRDEYIEIMYSNVEPSMRIWFNKYSGQEVNQYDVTYEYSSVMHYGITVIILLK